MSVNSIGLAMTAAAQSVLRLNLLHKCAMPGASVSTLQSCCHAVNSAHRFPRDSLASSCCLLCALQTTLFFCTPTALKEHGEKLALNTVNFRQRHHDLFLGGHGVQPFRDERLIQFWCVPGRNCFGRQTPFWALEAVFPAASMLRALAGCERLCCRTYKELPETLYYNTDASGLPALVSSNRTLWEMGNAFLNAIEEVYYFRDTWGATLDEEAPWQYAFLNGPGA